MRQAEKPPGLVSHVPEHRQTAALADDVEQIAMLTCRGVGPFSRRTHA
jgi:hypothetical protein